jgi:oxygen-dependent protoporphyrinogen oxidase
MTQVAIIGGGITGLAAAWELHQQGLDFVLLESAEKLGGKIKTERVDGFIIEGAADSFLATKPWAWQLCREIGLGDQLIGTNDYSRNVYVLYNGKLQLFPRGMRLLVPTDPDGLLESDLLSPEGKQRMLAETEVSVRDTDEDESLGSFVRRRFGQEALEVFGQPLLAGIYTGDPEVLSMQATFPNYLALEKKYGSVIRGTQEAVAPPLPPEIPQTAFISLRNGLYQLIEGLQARLAEHIHLNCGVTRIDSDRTIYTTTGGYFKPDAILLTTPAATAQRLVQTAAPALASELAKVRTVSSATVVMGFRSEAVTRPLDGFGFVVAGTEDSHLLASTWHSTKIDGRAPAGQVLLRVFVGGHRQESDVFLPDEELIALARREIQPLLGIEAPPVITRIFRWVDANTQYEVGHLGRVAHLRELAPAWLTLAGSPYAGVGIPDCVRQGRDAAKAIATTLMAAS